MIKQIQINNFKSIQECTLDLGTLTCLIGLNGAGKSTLLQACGFMASVMAGTEDRWLAERNWKWKDLQRRIGGKNSPGLLHFSAVLELKDGRFARWWCRYSVEQHRCSAERVYLSNDGQFLPEEMSRPVLSLENRRLVIGQKTRLMEQEYFGSVLSSVQTKKLPEECVEVRDAVCSLRSFDLLSPQGMRTASRLAAGEDMGADGGKIAAFVASFSAQELEALCHDLQQFFPSVQELKVKTKQGGYRELWVRQSFGNDEMAAEARQCSDGLLRILGILAALHGKSTLLCFDEIENGISFDLTSELAKFLEKSGKQILITTHDMLLVNFLLPESVQLVVKTSAGATRVVPFVAVPELMAMTDIYGPGDALLLTSLKDVSQKALSLAVEKFQ